MTPRFLRAFTTISLKITAGVPTMDTNVPALTTDCILVVVARSRHQRKKRNNKIKQKRYIIYKSETIQRHLTIKSTLKNIDQRRF